MAVRYEIGTQDPSSLSVHTVEIDDSSYGGSSETIKGHTPPIIYNKQLLDPRTRQSTPILKTELMIDVKIETSAHQDLLDDVLDSDESRFALIYKIDGVEEWRGQLLPDLTVWPEDSAPYLHVQFYAKDFTNLGNTDFPDEDETETIITTLAECLAQTGITNNIKTYTSWTEDSTTDSEDFLNQIYHRTKNLIDLNKNEDTTKRIRISYAEALRRILLNYGLICTQGGGEWHIWQESAFETPASVVISTYNSSGVLQSTSTSDPSYAPSTVTIQSSNQVTPGLKKVSNKFQHRSETFIPRLPSTITLSSGGTETESFNITYTGDEVITISGFVTAKSTSLASGGTFRVQLRAGQYYWNGNSWISGTATPNTYYLVGGGLQDDSGNYVYSSQLNIVTTEVPSDATSPLEIIFYSANINTTPVTSADSTVFQTLSLQITNLAVGDANKESIDFELVQDGSYSETYEHPKTYFGDGPAVTSASALKPSLTAGDITSNTWSRRDIVGNRGFHDNLLQELMDTNRKSRQLLSAEIKAEYEFALLIAYDGGYFLNIGGSYDPYNSTWNPSLLRTVVDAQSDTSGGDGDDTDRPYVVGLPVAFPGFIENLPQTAIGIVTETITDTSRTSIDVELDLPVRVGVEYWIINESELDRTNRFAGVYPIVPSGTAGASIGPGALTLSIEDQLLNVPEGSFIFKSPDQNEADVNVTEERLSDAQDNIDNLNNVELPALEASLDTLNNTTLPNLQADLDDAEASLDTLNNTTLPNLQSELDTAEDDINTLETVTIPNLQSELDDVLPITETDITDGAISTPKLAANSVIAGKIATGAVTTVKLDAQAVTAAKITTGTITALQIASNTITANEIASDTITANEIVAGTITALELSADSVTANKIATDAVTTNKIQAGAITAVKIDTDAVTANKIDVADLAAINATMGSLTVNDTLTISTGEITNSASTPDYYIDDDGFNIAGSSLSSGSGLRERALSFFRDGSEATVLADISYNDLTAPTGLEIYSSNDLDIDADDEIYITAVNGLTLGFNSGDTVEFVSTITSGTFSTTPTGYLRVNVDGNIRRIRTYADS